MKKLTNFYLMLSLVLFSNLASAKLINFDNRETLAQYWSGSYDVQDYKTLGSEYYIVGFGETSSALRQKLEAPATVTLTYEPSSVFPICVERTYKRGGTRLSRISWCFKIESVSGDGTYLRLTKEESGLFKSEIVLHRLGNSNFVDINMRRQADPRIETTPLGEPATMNISMKTERVPTDD